MTHLLAARGAVALALALGPVIAQQPGEDLTPRHLVQVRIDDLGALDRLLALDLDLAACQALELPARSIDVICKGDRDIRRIREAGLPVAVAIRDLEAWHARELARFGTSRTNGLTPAIGQGGMGGHYTLAEMEAILDDFARSFPALCTPKASIGQTTEGRDIWVVKISDNAAQSENEARVWFDAVHHAREPVSMTATLAFMDWLLSNHGSDPLATFLVDERELFFLPCLNPDGYEHNRRTNPNGGGMWRKNRRNNGNGTYGVDLNRNYSTGWSAPNGGNSTDPNSETYRGPAPFSEPETTALEAFMAGMGFAQSCTTHTYTDVLLHPWGYLNGAPSNASDYDALGPGFVDDNGVAYGPVSTLLYIAAGSAVDHHQSAHGILAWTPELGRRNEGGFWPTPPTQIAIVGRHLTMFRDMALTAGALIEFGGATITEEPGSNGDGAVGPGENGAVQVTVRNDGLAAPAGGGVSVTLASRTPGVTVLSGTAVAPPPARLGTTATTAGALRIAVAPGFGGGVATLRVTVTGGGRTVQGDVRFRTEPLRVAVDDDLEGDRGFAEDSASTATTGHFERGTPQQTTYNGQVFQVAGNHTPAGSLCWITDARAGSSAGSYDVDGGFTDLISPVVDLSHLSYAELAFWRWYAESVGNDSFEVAVSSDGGRAWTTLVDDPRTTGGWIREVLVLPTPLTDRMQFRFRAQDHAASLVEAGIDDLEILGVGPDGGLTLLSSGALGSRLRVGIVGSPNAVVTALASPSLGTPITIPGIGGTLVLDAALILALPSRTLGPGGATAFDIVIPNDPNLRNVMLHWQAVHAAPSGWSIGNAQSVTFR